VALALMFLLGRHRRQAWRKTALTATGAPAGSDPQSYHRIRFRW
jgi:hypothetical protein